MKIGRITISDRASAGVYADRSGPEIENVLREEMRFQGVVFTDDMSMAGAAVGFSGRTS